MRRKLQEDDTIGRACRSAGRTVQVQSGGATTSLVYDDEDRLTSVTGSFGTQSYSYNGYDTRATKTANGSVTSYHRDGSGVTAPLISSTGSTYTPGISQRRNGATTFLHGCMKDTSAQSDTSQNITATRKYDAYGMVTSASGTWQGPFGYSGQAGYQEDETGLQLLGHRYYDPSTGRFLTRDPIKDGRNWYGYVANNPLLEIDSAGYQGSQRGNNRKMPTYLAGLNKEELHARRDALTKKGRLTKEEKQEVAEIDRALKVLGEKRSSANREKKAPKKKKMLRIPSPDRNPNFPRSRPERRGSQGPDWERMGRDALIVGGAIVIVAGFIFFPEIAIPVAGAAAAH